MKVSRDDALSLLEALGCKTAAKWDNEKMAKNLGQFAGEATEAEVDKLDKKQASLLKSVLTAEGDIEVTGEAKAGKKNKKKKGKATAEASANGHVEKDAFGNRKGSQAARFNAALSKVPQTMAELMKKAKAPATMYNHINGLIKRKLVKKTDAGYILAK